MKLEVNKIQSKQIDLWLCSIDSLNLSGRVDQLLSILSEDERGRCARFVFEKDRYVYLASRYLLRTLLSQYHREIAPHEWRFEYNDYGKPSISNQGGSYPVSFNLSHSANNVVLAFSIDGPLGVDIESYQRVSDLRSLASYSFSDKEYAQIEVLDEDQFRDRFFSLWTLKEAYMKADGRGMSLPLKSFSFLFDKKCSCLELFESEQEKSPESWLFWQYETGLECFIALAMRSEEKTREGIHVVAKEIIGFDKVREISLPLRGLAGSDLC